MPLPPNITRFLKNCKKMDFDDRAEIYNELSHLMQEMLETGHPALAVRLVKADEVEGNTYNPNKVAPPEMRLLELSIAKDGVTMPVVAAKNDKGRYTIVDGFHRVQVIKSSPAARESLHGYVPIVELNKDIDARIAATVRHNMARGTHAVGLTASLVVLLKRHNWTDERVSEELGMDVDEVLRMKQLTGLADAFADREFSKAWD